MIARKDSAQKSSVPSSKKWLNTYFSHHQQAFYNSVQQFLRAPVANLMTVIVIAIALALPAGAFVVLQNIRALSQGWDRGERISLFLKLDVSDSQAQAFAQQLAMNRDLASVHYISSQQGLAEFKKRSGFGDVLTQLNTNPLPAVIEVLPAKHLKTPEQIENLLEQLKHLPNVDIAQLDMEWLQRLYSLIDLGEHLVLALGIFLGIGVLFIIGNTIRLAIVGRREEIQVIKLVGGTHGFIQRPFLYIGMMYGLLGAILAWTIVWFILYWLSDPITRLIVLYQSLFHLEGFDFVSTIFLFAGGAILGIVGAWVVVNRQLSSIEPK